MSINKKNLLNFYKTQNQQIFIFLLSSFRMVAKVRRCFKSRFLLLEIFFFAASKNNFSKKKQTTAKFGSFGKKIFSRGIGCFFKMISTDPQPGFGVCSTLLPLQKAKGFAARSGKFDWRLDTILNFPRGSTPAGLWPVSAGSSWP